MSPKRSPVGALASADTRTQFADTLSSYTTLTAEQAANLFPTKADRDELVALLSAVRSATNDNQRRTRVIEQIESFAGAVVKIVAQFTRTV